MAYFVAAELAFTADLTRACHDAVLRSAGVIALSRP
jgi:hypothetical protein